MNSFTIVGYPEGRNETGRFMDPVKVLQSDLSANG